MSEIMHVEFVVLGIFSQPGKDSEMKHPNNISQLKVIVIFHNVLITHQESFRICGDFCDVLSDYNFIYPHFSGEFKDCSTRK